MLNLIRDLSRPQNPASTSSLIHVSQQPSPLHGIRGVLFDVYGTLLISRAGSASEDISRPSKQDSMRKALLLAREDPQMMPRTLIEQLKSKSKRNPTERLMTEASLLVQRLEDMIEADHTAGANKGIRYPEVNIKSIWRRLLPEKCFPSVIRAAVSYECLSNPTWPMPNAADTIAQLKSWCPVGIVSNAQFYTPLVLKALLPDVIFDQNLTVWSFAEKVAKPSKQIFQRALDNMMYYHGIPPDQILMVGNDLLNDIWGAHQMGMKGALFAGDANSLFLRHDDPRCLSLKPELILTDLSQLPTLIANNTNNTTLK